ncbi:hypothetical protein B6N25_08410 [Sphingobacteriales bacterium TSM_CSS]|nr:hypothetical protein B6N25_08410 [Sphingobacteriales bacterium TSM_CSS]
MKTQILKSFLKKQFLLLVAVSIAICMSPFLQAQTTCPGTVSATFNGVAAKLNCPVGSLNTFGYNYDSGINTGYRWQCVEYVNRYYYMIYNMDLKSTPMYGNAAGYYTYTNHASIGLLKYANGGSVPPQVGDMIVSTSQTYGHIAIVTSVTSTTVGIIDQNFSSNSARTLTRSGNTVAGFSTSYTVAGWIRKNTAPATTPTLLTPANSATGLTTPINFSWSCPNGTEYRIQIVEAAYYTGFSASTGLNGSSCTNCAYNQNLGNITSFSWTGAQPGKTYYWTVRASNSGGASSFATYRTFYTASSTTTCAVPTGVNHNTVTTSSANIIWTASSSGTTSFTVERKTSSATTWTPATASATASSYNITGLTAGTTYQYRIKRNCSSGSSSAYSATGTFTTTSSGGGGSAPANNDPCGATTIYANSSCSNTSGTNVGATTTTSPGNPTSCTLTGGDVWFKVQVPSSGVVTIRLTAGTLTDALMAVYYGSSCSSLAGITCEDDNTNGNGSYMPVITITGYAAGTWLYARVWGFGGASGTFSICAMNYATVNKMPEHEEMGNISFSLFPNPAGNLVTVNYLAEEEENLDIRIFDLSGKVVYQQTTAAQTGNNKLPINTEHLLSGMYVINVQTPTKSATEKLQIFK